MNRLNVIKGKKPKQIIKGGINYFCDFIRKIILHITPPYACGISGNTDIRVIVSLTSFPKRIKGVHLCIKTLLHQTYKPDAIILWLAPEQFPNREDDLPKKLTKLKKHGLTIKWCNNIRSYKKIVPTLNEYPNATIITTDDDVYYQKTWLAGLMEESTKHPNDVCCYRASKISFDKEKFVREPIAPFSEYPFPTYLHQQTGVGGVLYPPNSLYDDVCKSEIFMDIAETNDDLWLWMMGILAGTKVRILENNTFKLFYIGESQKYSLASINNSGEMLYYKQLANLFEQYPQVLETLKQEFSSIQSKL